MSRIRLLVAHLVMRGARLQFEQEVLVEIVVFRHASCPGKVPIASSDSLKVIIRNARYCPPCGAARKRPFAEGLAQRLSRELRTTKDGYSPSSDWRRTTGRRNPGLAGHPLTSWSNPERLRCPDRAPINSALSEQEPFHQFRLMRPGSRDF